MLLGADASGNDNSQHEIISFVIGTESSLLSLYHEIGFEKIHMKKMKDDKKQQVRKNLDFSEKDRSVFSFKVDKMNIVHEMHNHKKRKDKYAEVNLIFREFDMLLLSQVEPLLKSVSINEGKNPAELRIQVDEDMRHTVKHWGWGWAPGGIAYELADGVAYCHHKRYSIPGTIILDISKHLKIEMKKKLLK